MALETQDLLEIQNLIAKYTVATDNRDVDGFMNCWVSPEEFEGYDSGAFGHLKTWQELKDFESHHVSEGGDANGKRHQATNILIEAVSDTEVNVTHDMIVLEVAEIPMVVATGRYNDSKVVKTEKGWKFKWRKLDIDTGFFKLMEKWKSGQ
ncbi:nuclear transport factor 2 family protein [Catalinimonas sp. 4WD22]|uniref:nuclear transport factor 2 family protein n=1 Tax=Catalinimonas locisalis TaxID=3133978 RepID=UPI0031012AB7